MEIDEKEARIRAKYRKEIEENVQRELSRIKEAERIKQKEIEAETRVEKRLEEWKRKFKPGKGRKESERFNGRKIFKSKSLEIMRLFEKKDLEAKKEPAITKSSGRKEKGSFPSKKLSARQHDSSEIRTDFQDGSRRRSSHAKDKILKESQSLFKRLKTNDNQILSKENLKKKRKIKKRGGRNPRKKWGNSKSSKTFSKTENEDNVTRRKSYVPIIIDKEAFERTVGKFQSIHSNNEELNKNEENLRQEQENDNESSDLEEEESNEYLEEECSYESSSGEEVDKSPDPVDDLRERISLELAKINETEFKFNEQIQRENKKRELMRAIEEEISKIKDLTSPNDLAEDDSDNIPEWIKRFQSYKPTQKEIHDPQKEIHKPSNKEEEFMNEENTNPVSSSMVYQDMIEALLSLSEEDKSLRKSNTIIETPRTENETRPEIKGLQINDVKNMLLSSSKENPYSPKSKTEQRSNLQKIVCRREGEERPLFKFQRFFSSLPETEKDIENGSTQKREWAYKQKQMSDLGHFLQENANILPSQILEKGTQVLSQHNHDQRNDSYLENDQDEHAPLLDSVKVYLENSPEKNMNDSVFMESLRGYLDLIEEDDDQIKTKDKPKFEKQIKLDTLNICALQSKILSEDRNNNDSKKENNRIIGKLDGRLFESKGDKDNKPSRLTPPKRFCSDIKDHLEKKNRKEKTPDKITRRKILVDVIEPNNNVRGSKKDTSTQDWKWKKKDPKELWNDNTILSDKEVGIPQKSPHPDLLQPSTEEERHNLIKRTQLLADRTKQREKEYKKFISTLRNYSANEITGGAAMDGIESYLQLIDEDSKEDISQRNNNSLPQIDVPWKINKAKDKLTAATAQRKSNNTKRIEVGKLGTFKDKCSNKIFDQSNPPSKDPQTKPIHGIKTHFEDIMKNGSKMGKSLSEINLTPRLSCGNNSKSRIKISEYFQSDSIKKSTTAIKTNRKEVVEIKSKWDAIKDPEERKRAILAKHGVKLRKPNNHGRTDELLSLEECSSVDQNTFDEDSYKVYLRERTGIDFDSDDEEVESNKSRYGGGSVSSLLNILGSVRKTLTSKQSNGLESSSNRMAQSEIDLSQIPGSCSNIRHRFEAKESSSNREPRSHVPKRISESSTNLSIRSELDVLRSSSSLRRQFSEQNLNSDKLISGRTPSTADLDNEVLEGLSKSNSAIKAMFEASAPKYKFGQKLTLAEEEKSKVHKPKRQEKKESRQWVLDSVNKYFDVIVEEEEDSEGMNNYSDSEYEEEESAEVLKPAGCASSNE
ncbi:unnamed protein product [Lepeophtheirus salmonis]|uniref:(salmon louse) hypothetical protein n=1 Tax=Lepeophtheirus salmonis TaxID=72036 RepID=A0A7R8CMN6_LEPSM|nr:unnamed protein product [Lepeophtheirus salmonis]CAF2868117.1 unnamed protein product [Lepeophtheirus salmonis]